MHEYGEIADLLRHRVGDDGDRRRDAELRAGEERGGDHDAVAEVVHAGADQDHESRAPLIGAAMQVQRVLVLGLLRVVDVVIVPVGVTPQHEFFQQEEREQPISTVTITRSAPPSSSACGKSSRKTAPSSAPTANDTSRDIHDGCSASVPAAAAVANTPPASAAMTISARTFTRRRGIGGVRENGSARRIIRAGGAVRSRQGRATRAPPCGRLRGRVATRRSASRRSWCKTRRR